MLLLKHLLICRLFSQNTGCQCTSLCCRKECTVATFKQTCLSSSVTCAGHIILGKQNVIATMHGSFLCASLEIGMLRRALMYACELQQAQPRTHSASYSRSPAATVPRSSPASGRSAGATLPGPASTASTLAPEQQKGLSSSSADATPGGFQQAVVAPAAAEAKPLAKRNLTMQVFLHCARIDVSAPALQTGFLLLFHVTAAVRSLHASLRAQQTSPPGACSGAGCHFYICMLPSVLSGYMRPHCVSTYAQHIETM